MAKVASVLLVDDNAARRRARAIVLVTHGYQVQCAASYEEAQRQCRANKPDFLLIGVTHPFEASWLTSHDSVFDSQQALGFLLNEGQQLCAVHFNGKLLLPREGSDDLVSRVAMLPDRHATALGRVVSGRKLNELELTSAGAAGSNWVLPGLQ